MADGSASFTPPIPTNDVAAEPGDTGYLDARMTLAPMVQMARAIEGQQRTVAQWIELNRTFADGMRSALRRQQDLALDLAESALAPLSTAAMAAPAASPDAEKEGMMPFTQAGRAFHAMSVAVIEAQIAAIRAASTDRGRVDRAI
jgi:hypothetical protein